MLSINITATGKTLGDIMLAIEEAKREINEGFVSGGDKNNSGSYSYDVTGEEEEAFLLCDECGASFTEIEAIEKKLEQGSQCPDCKGKLKKM